MFSQKKIHKTFSKVEKKRKRAYEMGDVLSIDPFSILALTP